jgi:hypothetical protein
MTNIKITTHYFKWYITKDISIRYHFIYLDKPFFENRYIIKSHNNNLKQKINNILAENIINELNLKPVEIIGRNFNNNEYFEKLLINNDFIYLEADKPKIFYEQPLSKNIKKYFKNNSKNTNKKLIKKLLKLLDFEKKQNE